MVQTRFDRENTPCDDCILWFTCICYNCVQIARCFIDVPDGIELAADLLVHTVDGCMHAQQETEIKDIMTNFPQYQGMTPAIMNAVCQTYPKQQQMVKGGGGGYGGGGVPQNYGR
jgi:hypothetical protein